jgi:lantibiotic biosynthesis protein
MTPAVWTPVLEGEAALQATSVVREIAAAFRAGHTIAEPTIDATLALFFAELARGGSGDEGTLALTLIERAMDNVGEIQRVPALFGGFTGVACAVSLLTGRLLAPPASDEDDPCAAVDDALVEMLDAEPFSADTPFDLIEGLVGLGVYALTRADRPVGRRVLLRVIARLDELSVKRVDGKAWRSPSRSRISPQPAGTLDLGLAHGVAGVIAMLGAACAHGVDEARPLLGDAVSFLLAQEKLAEGSCFPGLLVPGAPQSWVRSAWCYGDPGIAAALLIAARGAVDPAWEAAALRVARTAAARPPGDAGVTDASLCHGAAGLGHVYNRLFQATRDEALGAAARFWLGRALEMRVVGSGLAGYRSHFVVPGVLEKLEDNITLLRGATGIGLALMAATASEEPAWDRFLLLAPIHAPSR